MPVSFPPVRPHPGKPVRTLADAATHGELVQIRCNLCRHFGAFLASDLAAIVGPKHPAHVPPFRCPRCKTFEYLDVRTRHPSKDEYGKTVIRRPVVRQVVKWRTARLGE